jgi:hypothetical protein
MKILPLAAAAIFALVSGALAAECVTPEAPAVPDGATSDKETFIAGYQKAKGYLADGEAYLKCLETEEKTEMDAGTSTDETQAARLTAYNASVDQMQAVGEALNTEVREFKARGDQQ